MAKRGKSKQKKNATHTIEKRYTSKMTELGTCIIIETEVRRPIRGPKSTRRRSGHSRMPLTIGAYMSDRFYNAGGRRHPLDNRSTLVCSHYPHIKRKQWRAVTQAGKLPEAIDLLMQ